MKGFSFFFILVAVLAVFFLLNFYIIRRGWQALAGTSGLRAGIVLVYAASIVCFFVGRALARSRPGRFSEILSIIGSFYMGILVYLFLLLVFVDFLRLVDRVVPFFPAVIRQNGRQAGRAAFFAVTGITLALTLVGFIHMRYFRVKTMDIMIDKRANGMETMNIVVLADIHVGPFLHNPRLEKIVQTINSLNPDLVLIPGDIVNEETLPSELEKMTATFRKIRSRYGVFASTGNHEYFSGIEKSLAYLKKSGFTVLQDEAVAVNASLVIAGRINSSYIAGTERRKPLTEILRGVDMNLPVILLDHQPVHLEESRAAGVDLQVSGHTHGGGIFPFTLINDRLYEIGRGYGRKGKTQYYVTSGVGIWEPPARIGTTAEIVLMKVKFRP